MAKKTNDADDHAVLVAPIRRYGRLKPIREPSGLYKGVRKAATGIIFLTGVIDVLAGQFVCMYGNLCFNRYDPAIPTFGNYMFAVFVGLVAFVALPISYFFVSVGAFWSLMINVAMNGAVGTVTLAGAIVCWDASPIGWASLTYAERSKLESEERYLKTYDDNRNALGGGLFAITVVVYLLAAANVALLILRAKDSVMAIANSRSNQP